MTHLANYIFYLTIDKDLFIFPVNAFILCNEMNFAASGGSKLCFSLLISSQKERATFLCLCLCVCRGVGVLRYGVLGDLHFPGALLSDAEQELAGLQCFHRKQQQGERGHGLQLRHLAEAGHASDCQHLQPAIHRCHPGQERYKQVLHS